jgi:hypothetical protein
MPVTGSAEEAIARIAYVHYAWLLDSGQWARVGEEVFALDSVQDIGSGMVRTGRREIQRALNDTFSDLHGTAHYVTNISVELTSDTTANSRAYLQTWHWGSDDGDGAGIRAADFVGVGVYLDEVRLEPEGWRITHRRRRLLGPGPIGFGSVPDNFADRVRGLGQGAEASTEAK